MRRESIKRFILISLSSCILTGALVFLLLDLNHVSWDRNKEIAFQECLEEVKNDCGSIIGYATALENENAKLNRKLAELRSECTVTH